MKAIVYTSETGHTARYAALLSKATGLPAMTLREAKKTLPPKEKIFYLGWLMAGGVKGFKTAQKRFTLRGVTAVGMSPAANGFLLDRAKQTGGIVDGTRVFYLQGGYAGDRLHGVHRLMMKTMESSMGKKLAAKPNRTPEEESMLSLLRDGRDCVREENLTEILDWLAQGC